MELGSRYEIVDTIATGDFATVYRARDRELGREVAIKQIHQQFLSDERQLARYWQEAQLLASLQHPNILTIYDIVRPRGWLILELMRGNLQQGARDEPLDLDFLRVALSGCLGALQFLHTNGVIHGDVKPSNMLVDSQNRVKLGDFGLARRASSEEGSLLKGTTKYMAPELVSAEFGAVGPPSDLYSLGFSAYELMCGPRFESLFPGLSSFGRDKQIAWMMWHAAADRNLPEIGRVLEGVPDDLARVIQKLVVKDQARRYQSARDVLRDLKADPLGIGQPPEQEDAEAGAAAAREAKRKKLLRVGAIFAVALSLILCLRIFLPKKQKPPPPPGPTRGVVTRVDPDKRLLALELTSDGSAEEREFKRYDRFFLNDKSVLLRDLRPKDKVIIRTHDEEGRWLTDESGHRSKIILASRPQIHNGQIQTVEANTDRFALGVDEGEDKGKTLLIRVPATVKIIFNGKPQFNGEPIKLADLTAGDRVEVHHVAEETGRKATELIVQRVVTLEGIIRDVDAEKGKLTVAVGGGDNPELVPLEFAPRCEVTINDRRVIDEKVLKPANLRPGDKVTVAHDVQVVRVDAYRTLGQSGTIQRVHYDANTLEVVLEGSNEPVTYIIGPQCKITLGGEPVTLTDLRDGDAVDVTHDSPGAKSPEAVSVAARRPVDRTRWAILIAVEDYEDKSLTRLSRPQADANLLRDVLIKHYRVPPHQAQSFINPSLVRLRQGVRNWLAKAGTGDSMIVYFSGHAYKDDKGTVYLAPNNFDFKQMGTTGLALQWLVDELENCPAGQKLLLLDCSHFGKGADLASQPSTAEMIQTLNAPPGRGPLKTVTAVASCSAGQRGLVWDAKGHGMFSWCLAEGYKGRADKNRDNRMEATELFSYLTGAMATAGRELAGVQTPVLILPDTRPPRLTEDAKKAIRKLAAFLRQDRIDVAAATEQYGDAAKLAGKELEPRLLYGLLLMKAKQRDAAFKHLEELKIEHTKLLLPLEGMVWLRFEKRTYTPGAGELIELVNNVPKPQKPADPYPERAQRIFYWTGQLREFAATAVQEGWRPSPDSLAALDAAIAGRGGQAERFYELGRARTRAKVNDFDKRIAGAEVEADVAKLKVERRRLVHYVAFPFDRTVQRILAGLDQ